MNLPLSTWDPLSPPEPWFTTNDNSHPSNILENIYVFFLVVNEKSRNQMCCLSVVWGIELNFRTLSQIGYNFCTITRIKTRIPSIRRQSLYNDQIEWTYISKLIVSFYNHLVKCHISFSNYSKKGLAKVSYRNGTLPCWNVCNELSKLIYENL